MPTLEDLDDDHGAAAAWAWRRCVSGLWNDISDGGRCHAKEPTDMAKIIPAGAAGEQAIVADAVEPLGQIVQRKTANELVGGERHHLLSIYAVQAIVLEAEGDIILVETDEPAVRDGNSVAIARQIGKYGPGVRQRATWIMVCSGSAALSSGATLSVAP